MTRGTVSMSEWISVKDRLPEDNQWIIYSSGDICCCSFGRYCGEEDPMPSAKPWLEWDRVKFWMSIPDPPEEYR